MSTVWLRVSRGDCLTPAPPGQQGPPKLLVRARYSAQEAPAVSNLASTVQSGFCLPPGDPEFCHPD